MMTQVRNWEVPLEAQGPGLPMTAWLCAQEAEGNAHV